MTRAARWVRSLILGMVALLLSREPEALYQEPGFQPSAVMHPDDSHRDQIVTVEDIRPQVEQAPPPVAVPSPRASSRTRRLPPGSTAGTRSSTTPSPTIRP